MIVNARCIFAAGVSGLLHIPGKAGPFMTFYEKMRIFCLAIPVGKFATY